MVKTMEKIWNNNNGSITILLVYVFCIISLGALYTLFFIEVAIPELAHLIPESTYKTLFLTITWSIPLIIGIVISFATIKAGLKRSVY